jgi:Tfp pilus assembly protein PilO
VVRVPNPIELKSGFGEYHTEFKIEGTVLKVIRTFRIPAQVVPPSEYRDFSNFALQIDSAERELIQLRRMDLAQVPNTAPLARSPQPLH